jgi:hypothetical protein
LVVASTVQEPAQAPAEQASRFGQLVALHSQTPPFSTGFVGSLRRQAPLVDGVALQAPSSLQNCEPQTLGIVVQGWQACVAVSQKGVVPAHGLAAQATQPLPTQTVLPVQAAQTHWPLMQSEPAPHMVHNDPGVPHALTASPDEQLPFAQQASLHGCVESQAAEQPVSVHASPALQSSSLVQSGVIVVGPVAPVTELGPVIPVTPLDPVSAVSPVPTQRPLMHAVPWQSVSIVQNGVRSTCELPAGSVGSNEMQPASRQIASGLMR